MISTKLELEDFTTSNWNKINEYINDSLIDLPMSIYNSVDIREGQKKFAPIDNNIYPAGFNNLCALDLEYATSIFSKEFGQSPDIKKIGIWIESNTKNLFYLDHLVILGKSIRDTIKDVYFISLDSEIFPEGQHHVNLIAQSKWDIKVHFATIVNGKIQVRENQSNISLDYVVLNNDQSKKIPVSWEEIRTPVNPSGFIGWYRRQKTRHFEFYHQVVEKFCNEFTIDSSLIEAKFNTTENVDFASKDGLSILAKDIDELKSQLEPNAKIFVKASQGTYGMGIHVVENGNDILSLNRKIRNKMDIGKNKIKFTSILNQESVETALRYNNAPAEITIYLIKGIPVGGFMRSNPTKDSNSNLNSRGMVFQKFCISEIKQNSDHKSKEAVYSVIARLSAIASAYEIKEVESPS